MKKPKTVRQVLVAARAALVEHGWCQRTLLAKDGRMCVDGAIRFAVSGDAIHKYGSDLHRWAANRLCLVIEDEVTTWNDRRRRTKRQVLAAFDKAIRQESRR